MDQNKLFTKETLLTVVCGILLNMLAAQLVLAWKLPLFLDSLGTIYVAALCGTLPGITVGFFSNVINAAGDPITLYYGIISILLGYLAAHLSLRKMFVRYGKALLSSLLFALIGGGLGALLTWMLSGLDFGTGISAPYAYALFDHYGFSKFAAQLTADLCVDIPDKAVSLSLVWLMLRFTPARFLDKLPMGSLYVSARKKPAADTSGESGVNS